MSCRFNAPNGFNPVKNHMKFIEKLGGLNVKMKLTWDYMVKYLLHRNSLCIDVSRQPCGINTFF